MAKLEKNIKDALIDKALDARNNAYSPYSDFCVGAALLTSDGETFVGSNVENSSFGGTICAERAAFVAAISHGKRDFAAIAIVGAKRGEHPAAVCPPCGICRQFMAEFCNKNFEVILFDGKDIKAYTLEEVLPLAFTKSDLGV